MNHLLFEEALGEEDEYQRLTKISDAIKLVAGAIMRIKTFNNWQILKYMICSYPFQQEVIQLLMNTIFDYFQDIEFLNAFEKTLLEIAQLKEQRVFLSMRSQSLRIGVLQQNYNNLNIRKEQLKQSAIPFAKAVIEQLTVAKKFAASYIKKYLVLAKTLNQDIKQRVFIIKDFVVNTRDHHFIILLINTFEELKQTELKDQKWVVDFDRDIEQYCAQNNILVPLFIEKQNKPKSYEQNSSDSSSDDDDDFHQQNKQSNSNSGSDQQSIVDEDELLQRWIAQKYLIFEQQQIEIVSKEENLLVLIDFILNPIDQQIDDCWKDQYPMVDITDDGLANKIRNQKIEFYATVRSFNTAQMFHHRQNLEKLQQYNPTFLQKFFKQTSESFQNKNRNLNLYHLALTIDSCLSSFPKSSMALILENQLLFALSSYIYNPLIMGLLIDIHQIQYNKYDFGPAFTEQVWKYQLFTDWFMWLQNILFEKENDQKQLDLQYKGDNLIFIIRCLKELSKKEQKIAKPKTSEDNKIKLTSLFGSLQSGKNLMLQDAKDYDNWKLNIKVKEHLTLEEFKSQDYDNLMDFIKQRDQIYKQQLEKKIQDELQIQIDNIQLKRTSRVRMSQVNSSFCKSPTSNSKLIFQSTSPNQSQTNSQPNSSRSIKLPSIYSNNQYNESKLSNYGSQGEISLDLKSRNLSIFGQSPKNSKLGLASQRRLKTENDDAAMNSIQSNDGFSSSRLITIYPSKQAQIKFEQSKIVQRQDQSVVENCLGFFSEIIKTILDYFQQPNKTNLQQLNEQILIQQILSMNFLNSIFEIYLSSIIDQNVSQQKIGESCGQLINLIYHKSHHIELFQLLREQLRTIFLANVDNLTRAIVAINKQMRLTSKFVNKCQLQLLLQTYFFGFNLFSIHTQLISTSNIYKHLNETVMHIFIIWYFDSQQNNCYQYFFTKFLTILFAKAPFQSLSNILFNIGLVNSIYNALQQFWVNGMKSSCFQAGVYFYMRMIVYVINKALNHRNIQILKEYLQPLESWKGVCKLIPEEDSNYMIELQELLKTGQTPIRRIQLKRTKLEKLKSQLTVDCFDSKLREIKQFEQAQQEKQKLQSTPKIPQQGKKLPPRLSQRSFRNRISLKNDN
ncbi:unnamed protein product [Paramecium octaurelia]|uniref:Uncharacterized protein n=1 Tax=Paramecium octaurelia TaxID=43137 RepID=A0A8S1RXW0_PAROT|nr:unnamed protein product [Paramecium octaurelia]